MGYDIIGDVHGHLGELEALLSMLGYQPRKGTWKHPERTAVFVGDFIDRGPAQVDTYSTVRAMIDGGAALAVMGNHEFNAIAYHTPDDRGGYLRARSAKNQKQHAAFLSEVEGNPDLHSEIVGWFLELPLWLDLDGFRVVHACWHDDLMGRLKPSLREGQRLTRELVTKASKPEEGEEPTLEYQAIETLTKGLEINLPEGRTFPDKDGHVRAEVRVRWWEADPITFREAGMLPADQQRLLPDVPIPQRVLPGYDADKPVFIGHYWMSGTPKLLHPKIACVDYSAGRGGPLVAYRWDGESELSPAKFMASR